MYYFKAKGHFQTCDASQLMKQLTLVLLMCAGKQEAVEATLMALEVVSEPLKSMATILVDVCAYAGQFFDWSFCHFAFVHNKNRQYRECIVFFAFQ